MTEDSSENSIQVTMAAFEEIMGDLGQMGSIYQSIYALLNQSMKTKEDKMLENIIIQRGKITNAQAAINSKTEEIKEKIESAFDQFFASCCLSVSKCVASIIDVQTTNQSNKPSVRIPSKKYLSRYNKKIKISLSEFHKLYRKVEKLIKYKENMSLNSIQIEKINILIKKLKKLKYYLKKSNDDNNIHLKKLRTVRLKLSTR